MEEAELKEQVKKKQIELEAKSKALDKKVIDEIINKTAEIIDEKVKNLAEDLKRKIDESAKKPEAALKSTPLPSINGAGGNGSSSNGTENKGEGMGA